MQQIMARRNAPPEEMRRLSLESAVNRVALDPLAAATAIIMDKDDDNDDDHGEDDGNNEEEDGDDDRGSVPARADGQPQEERKKTGEDQSKEGGQEERPKITEGRTNYSIAVNEGAVEEKVESEVRKMLFFSDARTVF